MNSEKEKELLFPYPKIRKIQDKLIVRIMEGIQTKKDIIVHAPTGLGKTVAALGTLIPYAKRNKLKIVFMTSRHTQHTLAIKTCRDIKAAFDFDLLVTDLIGKKWMCAQAGVSNLYSGEFSEFCRSLRESRKCEFYENTKKSNKLSPEAKIVMEKLMDSITHTEKVIDICKEHKLCPYEMALSLAARSDVIISDYYYLFNPSISEHFLKRAGIDIEEVILVVDEAHNLPTRIRDLLSTRISSSTMRRAIREAKKNRYEETIKNIVIVQDALNMICSSMDIGEERIVKKEEFITHISEEADMDELISDLSFIADEVRKKQRQSSIGTIAAFLEEWQGEDEGYARIAEIIKTKHGPQSRISYLCLDPSMISKDIISQANLTLMMSGTLTPTSMYKDLLGFENAILDSFDSPFPKENILNLIIPRTTTKYSQRNIEQYQNIANICADIINRVPGNTIVFFPSYIFRDSVYSFLSTKCKKTIFMENQALTKEEKTGMLERFKSYSGSGAVILGVSSGSFSEGVDLPGDLLKCVIVVGLPLQRPDLKTKSLIQYYDKKFQKGWDYGYVFPAFNKTIQSAGRCIRTENDKGAVIFLEERYLWPKYFKCFPQDWHLKIAKDYMKELDNFFS